MKVDTRFINVWLMLIALNTCSISPSRNVDKEISRELKEIRLIIEQTNNEQHDSNNAVQQWRTR